MKYCPFCGAELLGPEVSFCTECGKHLPAEAKSQTEAEAPLTAADPPRESKKKAASARLKRKPQKKSRSSIEGAPTERLKSRSGAEDQPEDAPAEDYDGYYDDIEPVDADCARPGLDREMIKKISLLVLGAVLVIGLCVIMMTLL